MSIKRYTKTFTYRHPNWHQDSYWELRSERTGKDEDALVELTTRTLTDGIDMAAVAAAQKRGDDIKDIIAKGIKQETVMSARNAALYHFTVSWGGPDFTLPDDYVKGEEFQQPEKDADGGYVPHPHAGKLMPVAPEFVGVIDPDELNDAERALNRAHAGRTEDEQATFPDGVTSLVGRPRSARK